MENGSGSIWRIGEGVYGEWEREYMENGSGSIWRMGVGVYGARRVLRAVDMVGDSFYSLNTFVSTRKIREDRKGAPFGENSKRRHNQSLKRFHKALEAKIRRVIALTLWQNERKAI